MRELIQQSFDTGMDIPDLIRLVRARHGRPIAARDIYNIKNTMKRALLGGSNSIKLLLEELERRRDEFDFNWEQDSEDRLSKLFICYSKSQEILRYNFDILVIDAIYKTNRYRMPLVNIVGQCYGPSNI